MSRFDLALGKPSESEPPVEITEEVIWELAKGARLIVSVDWWASGFVFKAGSKATINEVIPIQPYENSDPRRLPGFAIELMAAETFGALGRFTADNVMKHFVLES